MRAVWAFPCRGGDIGVASVGREANSQSGGGIISPRLAASSRRRHRTGGAGPNPSGLKMPQGNSVRPVRRRWWATARSANLGAQHPVSAWEIDCTNFPDCFLNTLSASCRFVRQAFPNHAARGGISITCSNSVTPSPATCCGGRDIPRTPRTRRPRQAQSFFPAPPPPRQQSCARAPPPYASHSPRVPRQPAPPRGPPPLRLPRQPPRPRGSQPLRPFAATATQSPRHRLVAATRAPAAHHGPPVALPPPTAAAGALSPRAAGASAGL